MKQTVKTSRTAGYLEKIYRILNERYFENALSTPIITIQTTPNAYGHISTLKVWKTPNGDHFEINLSANYLSRPIEEIVATMLHEMVHQYNLERNVQDTSRGNTYHNKIFKEEAEKRDLIITKHPTAGWTITEPTEALIEFCIERNLEEILMQKDIIGSGSQRPPARPGTDHGENKPKSSTRKYQCPQCKNSFRATKEIHAICADCMQPFIRV